MKSSDYPINIRAIQHYMYCPRRFGLTEINRDWAENGFVAAANLEHSRVHDGSHSYNSADGTVVRSSVAVYSDELDIFGITDCVEFIKSKDGAEIQGLEGKYRVNIIEYKPKPPKDSPFHQTDAIQVYAQKVCADSIWRCDCQCYIYYAETKRRVKLPFDTEGEKYRLLLEKYLREMREILAEGAIPPRAKGQQCSGCSIGEVCFAKTAKYSVKGEIMSMKGGEACEKAAEYPLHC